MLALQSGVGKVLRVEGVAVPGLLQSVHSLLPAGAVERAGQVVQGTISSQ